MPAPLPPSLLPSLESVTTIRADGSRPYLYPADTHGRFTAARRISGWFLIALYLSLPWIRLNGYPAVFLDVARQRFHLFGLTLAAQDLWLLFFLITGAGFSLFLLTALLGRVWCGWACPQTVFLDHVYRRIERWIEGDSVARRRLAAASWSVARAARKTLKHALFLLVSATIAHLFLAYFVSVPELWSMMRSAPVENWSAFAFIAIFTGVLYFNFAWFREQLCIVLCPYGRLQSVLIDEHSIVIGYDAARGEPRHSRVRGAGVPTGATAGLLAAGSAKGGPPAVVLAKERPPAVALAKEGDCVDCLRCVHVCPTGIDIRQGLQLECIGCTACIDACDDVMTRLHRPRGLIRYASQNALAGYATRWVRPRTVLYAVLLLAGATVATWAFSTVRPASVGVLRITGAPYIVDASSVRNQFFVRIVNKRNATAQFVVHLDRVGPGVHQIGFDAPVTVGPLAETMRPLIVQQDRTRYTGPFVFDIKVSAAGGEFTLTREAEFQGPEARLLREEDEERHQEKAREHAEPR